VKSEGPPGQWSPGWVWILGPGAVVEFGKLPGLRKKGCLKVEVLFVLSLERGGVLQVLKGLL
jgi:hypothetical protein